MFVSGPSSSSGNSFFMLFIHSVFLLCSFRVSNSSENCFVSFEFSCSFILMVSCQICRKNFYFVTFECPVLLVLLDLFQFLLNLLSFACIFCFYLFYYYLPGLSSVLFWSVHSNVSLCIFLSLAFLLVVAVSLLVLLTYLPIQVLNFFSGSLERYRFYHRLVLLLCKLTRLVLCCYSLEY